MGGLIGFLAVLLAWTVVCFLAGVAAATICVRWFYVDSPRQVREAAYRRMQDEEAARHDESNQVGEVYVPD